MLPVDFEYRMLVLGKPKSMTDEECMSLPVWSDGNRYISKWRLNKEELEMIQQTGEIYLEITSAAHPPVCVMVESPFYGTPAKAGDVVKGEVQVPGTSEILPFEGTVHDTSGMLVVEVERESGSAICIPLYLCKQWEFVSRA